MLESFFPIIAFLFGLIIGSFLNALIWRVQVGKSIFWKRSQCPRCGHELTCLDLVPVLSFVFLLGKCRHCKKKISRQYPIVELSTALLFSLFYLKAAYFLEMGQAVLNYQFLSSIFLQWFFVAVLVAIFVYDARYGLIPDNFTLPAILIALAGNFLLGHDIWNLLLATAIGGGFFLIQFLVSRGRWVGGGDIRLGALMGAILGYTNILPAIFFAYLIGAIFCL
ncbi:MAG: prepilin peptidase, partial [Parcubacteria group bacterium]|nr:prepilin peptidase [Parcubacteria group bacterium]